MNLEFEVKVDKLIVSIKGELDHHSAEEVRNKIDDRLDRDGLNKLIMDFSGVSFMDSSGIGVVIGRYKKLNLRKGSMCITGATDLVKRVFELSGLFKIVKLYGSVEEAIENI
ncbi:anti-sigma F factor antagonist [Clostridium luticellarii]|jgi:stage II sporulation protein AA (anti-sigma F factor antagonist)|uniref:Anti-sigma F factor antagonist n=1 Tax=Clostridium luticellarii TaxID=1691940 RepID=A0A2T0BLK8_9CLOT|nr:anti-sigma F factor antagonist [Clostridium luticellarii]MCI1944311.1 anti-sigma F factor antagonist [Clostridium luticellarii]MCI1967807.1 anti-sigma F factor antagonist [Clostridium luticellarii]MCI1994685.1 anti-sigma F factor antagonist [Clostridium luticellarii]MCI2038818.1 anti-sigma F factor antagonist [Clostridium luticellarii]PRR84765.1 Anti-sigma F factor antagonist [Clostridium luticellarii]